MLISSSSHSNVRLLHVIDNDDGYPPCLVFERGDDCLDQWLERTRADHVTKKSVLFRQGDLLGFLEADALSYRS